MSKNDSGKEITLVCAVADDGHTIDGKVAYKAPGWTEVNPTANLLCPSCSEVVLDDRTGLQVKTDDVRAMVAAMSGEDPSHAMVIEKVGSGAEAEVVLSTPEEVEAVVEPRFCGLCGEEIPADHPHALHSPCYGATRVYYAEDGVIYTGSGKKRRKVNMEKEFEWADQWLAGMVNHNGDLDFTAATVWFTRATEIYMSGKDDLLALRLAFVAKDAAARPYVDKMYDYLVQQANNLRDEGCLTDEIEKMLIRVEEFMGREWYIAAADMLKGNRWRNQSGAKHAVGKAWQTPRTQQTLKRVEEQTALLKGEPVEVPADALEFYKQAVRQLADNPWEADKKAQRALGILEPAVAEADRVRRAQFTEGLTFRVRAIANAAPEDVDELEEFVGPQGGGRGNRKSKVQSERDDGKGKRRKKKRTRRVEDEGAIAVSLERELNEPLVDRLTTHGSTRREPQTVTAGAAAS